MIYPALLRTTLHTTPIDAAPDSIVHEARAMVSLRSDGTWSLRYREADNAGQTSLSGTKAWMAIARDGNTTSRLLFRLGERLEAVYRTAQGEFEMATHTSLYNMEVDAHQGRLSLHYDLFIAGQFVAHNQLEVSWQREPSSNFSLGES